MEEKELDKGIRNAWILTVVAVIFVVAFFLFTVKMNTPARQATWRMGGTPFVPAGSVEAEGYHLPVQGKK